MSLLMCQIVPAHSPLVRGWRSRSVTTICALWIVFNNTCIAYSQDSSIMREVSPTAIVDMFQSEGYKAKLEATKSGRPVLRSSSSGKEWSIIFYGCNDGQSCTSLQFYTSYDLDNSISLEKINEYQKGSRFVKIWLDDELDPIVELDINLYGGVTKENILDWLGLWEASISKFEKFIDF